MFDNISKIKNKNKNKNCYILANGPSVNDFDLSLLTGNVIISMNASPILEKKFKIKSDYYVVSDVRFFNFEFKREIAEEKIEDKNVVCVFRKELKYLLNHKGKNNYYIESIGRDGFSFDLRHGYYFGCSTTFLAIQLAVYIGCTNIFLLGVDLDYDGETARFYDEVIPSPIDDNNCIQIKNIRDAFLKLKDKDINLYSCSKNSSLNAYIPYVRYMDDNLV